MSVSDVMGDYSIGVLSIPEIEQYGIWGVELLFNTNLIGSNMTSYSNLGYTDESVIPNIWKGTPIISEKYKQQDHLWKP
jgi:hypothetical protein